MSPGQKLPRIKKAIDWDLYYYHNLISHKYWRANGGHQNHQRPDLLKRLYAAEKYIRHNPDTPYRFFGVVDCPKFEQVQVEIQEEIDPDILASGKIHICNTDGLIAILLGGNNG